MAQQTAVEWLEKQLTLALGDEVKDLRGLFVVAKETEKKQIVNAHLTGLVYPLEMDASKQAEQYYKDNYKQNT